MKGRHVVLGSRVQIRKISRQAVHEVFAGRVCAQSLEPSRDRELANVCASLGRR